MSRVDGSQLALAAQELVAQHPPHHLVACRPRQRAAQQHALHLQAAACEGRERLG